MSSGMGSTSSFAQSTCSYCGAWHTGTCPRVKSIDYYPDGTVRRVELHDPTVRDPQGWPMRRPGEFRYGERNAIAVPIPSSEVRMGYLRPTAIVVNGTYDDYAEQAHAKAKEIFEAHDFGHLVSELLPPAINSTDSFFVGWDGSKEGWEDSDRGDVARAEFVAWLKSLAYEDGSSPLDWVELQYGGDDREVIALAHDGEREIVA